MIVLGIDPGFGTTGYSIVSKIKNKDIIIDVGYLPFKSTTPIQERIHAFYTFFKEKIITYKITTISLETPFLGKNVQSFLKLGYLRGIVHLLTVEHSLLLREFAPREVKQAITGFGGAEKEQVARVIYMLFPKLPQQKKADSTDAVAIGLCGLWSRSLQV